MDRSRSSMRRGAPAALLALGAALGCNAIIGAGDYKVGATSADAGASGGAAAGGNGVGGSSGASTGGTKSSGGTAATGGASATGGTAGATSSGGASGAASGGTTSTGGTASGGTTSTGGTASGGTTSTGGTASGGTTSTGGTKATGGTTSTGGTTAGSGGTATGGTGGRGGGTGGSGGTAEANASGESTCTGATCVDSLTCVTTPYGTTGICAETCTTTCAAGHLCATESGTSNSFCLQDCSTVACVDKTMRCLQTSIAHVCIPSGWKGGGIGNPCSSTAPCIDGSCLKTSTTTAGFCSASCATNADCNGSGTDGVNAEGQKNWCVDDSVNGNICYPGCDTLSTVCSKYPATSCQTITGTTENACASTN